MVKGNNIGLSYLSVNEQANLLKILDLLHFIPWNWSLYTYTANSPLSSPFFWSKFCIDQVFLKNRIWQRKVIQDSTSVSEKQMKLYKSQSAHTKD